MRKNVFLILSYLFIIILYSCNNYINESSKVVNNDSNLVSFSTDIQPLFNEDCSECHDYLQKENSYKMLTTKQSSCKVAPNYIDTVNPTSSYLYVKLHDKPPSGISMKGAHWTPENINKLLLWIEQGAKNN